MILVTGATGLLGRYTVAELAAQGMPVCCLVRNPERARQVLGPRPALVTGDVRDAASVRSAMQGIDAVVHLVAVIRESKHAGTFDLVNVAGTRTVAQAAQEAGVRRIVHISVLGAADEPGLHYFRSKWLGEQEVLKSDVPYTILRPSLLFGLGDEFFNLLAALQRLGSVVPVAGGGRTRFQPVAVQDVARCIALSLSDPGYAGRALNIGGPETLSYNEILDRVAEAMGVRKRLKLHVPMPLMRGMAWLMGRLLPTPPVTSEQLQLLNRDNVTETDAIVKAFGFAPRPVRGNLGYLQQVRWLDGVRVLIGLGLPQQLMEQGPTAS
ncbi:MAG: complex I NDUFA9 subunit family protein [Dehalococcoidia bacterium]|nr:complex I NDUFA9 subunit family protein [Dehalococcoidia bacterium]